MNIIDNPHYQRAFKASGFWLTISLFAVLLTIVFWHPVSVLLLVVSAFVLGIQLGALVEIKHREETHET